MEKNDLTAYELDRCFHTFPFLPSWPSYLFVHLLCPDLLSISFSEFGNIIKYKCAKFHCIKIQHKLVGLQELP